MMRGPPLGARLRRWSVGELLIVVPLVVVLAAYLRVVEANPAVAQTAGVTSWHVAADPGIEPRADVWRRIPAVGVALSGQNLAYPQGGLDLTGPGAGTVAVKSVHTDDTLYLSLSWRDHTRNDQAVGAHQFADAVAVQWPADPEVSVPSVCMGQADSAVNIWQWRADHTGPPSEVVGPNGYVDAAGADNDLSYPARAVGNPYAQVDANPVQNLVAGGFGTLAPVAEQVVEGEGANDGRTWTVVLRRGFAAPGEFQPAFTERMSSDVAFAVWDGARGDRDGMKSVTSFVQLKMSDEPAPSGPGVGVYAGATMLAIVVAFVGIVVATTRARRARLRADANVGVPR